MLRRKCCSSSTNRIGSAGKVLSSIWPSRCPRSDTNNGQGNTGNGSLVRFARQNERPPVALDNIVGYGEPKTGPPHIALGSKEWVHDMLQVVFGDTNTVVLHFDACRLLGGTVRRCHLDARSRVAQRLAGIVD